MALVCLTSTACTRIDRGSQPCVLVLGTPEDVHALLFPPTQAMYIGSCSCETEP